MWGRGGQGDRDGRPFFLEGLNDVVAADPVDVADQPAQAERHQDRRPLGPAASGGEGGPDLREPLRQMLVLHYTVTRRAQARPDIVQGRCRTGMWAGLWRPTHVFPPLPRNDPIASAW